ncbi:MAG: hypothetical protein H9802_14845 [Candidatus Phocaeicola faecipullorum]|nr:hypothetical protein [Candidatus Phocaeicola faecipullorum]
MRKKYLSALLFGAMITASTGTFTSCKDYDADIKNLQEQVDGIKNDENAVTTEELNSAINAAKADLNKQIADLQSKLESIEHPVSEDDITNLQSQIDDLKSKVSGLDDLKNRLSALETANKLFLEGGDFSAYKGLDKFINDEIVAALGENGAIYNYINNTVKSQILLEIKGGYEGSLKDIDDDLTALEQKYDALIGENGTIVSDINDLNLYMEAIKAALAGEDDQAKWQKLTELLQFVSDNKDALGSLITGTLPEGLKDDVETIIKDAEVELNGQKVSIEEGMQQLGMDIEALKGMVRSLSYIPTNTDRSVEFKSLYFLKDNEDGDIDGEYELGFADNAKDLKFRVSPASAASDKETFEKNYSVTLREDGEVSRAGSKFEAEIKSVENGFITISVKTIDNEASEKGTAVAIELNSKAESGESYKNVTSAYVPVFVNRANVAKVEYICDNKATDVIYRNGEATSIDYKAGGTYKLYAYGNSEITDFNEDVFSLFTTTFEKVSFEDSYFSLKDGVLTLTNTGASSYNKTAQVKAVTKIGVNGTKSFENRFGTVTVKNELISVDANKIITNRAFDYQKTDKVFTITKAQIMDAAGLDAATYDGLTTVEGTNTIDTRFAISQNISVSREEDGNITITVPAYALPGTKAIEFTLKDGNSETEVKVTFDITINDITNDIVTLENVANIWDSNNQVTFIPTIIGSADDFSINVSDLFSNWDVFVTQLRNYFNSGATEDIWDYAILTPSNTNYITVADGKITLKARYGGKKLTNEDFATVDLTLELKVAGYDQMKVLRTFKVQVSNLMSGYWVKADDATTEIKFTSSEAINTKKLISGYSWNVKKVGDPDVTMWESTDTDDNDLVDRRLSRPKFVITGANADAVKQYVSINETTGEITLNRNGFVLTAPLEATVEIQAESPWGVITSYAGNNTVKLVIDND